MTESLTEPLRCAVWASANRVAPIGTAGNYRGYLLVELPQPWPRDISETNLIGSLQQAIDVAGLRAQAILDPAGRRRRMVAYLNPSASGFSGFVGRETEYGDDPAAALAALMDDSGPGVVAGKDVLVCIHGRRDFCCGSMGAELAVKLGSAGLPEGVRLWRTSHTGGHRFAPNVIVLPEGTLWAHADESLVERVLSRSGPVDEVLDHYRGCAGLPSPPVQALEREVLRQVGWDLLDMHREGKVEGGGLTSLTVRRSDGSSTTWSAEVTAGRTMPVPECGRPIEEAKKSETEWVVGPLRSSAG